MTGFREADIGPIPESWSVKTVGELVDDKIIEKPMDGNHGGKHPKGSDFTDCGIPFIMAAVLHVHM